MLSRGGQESARSIRKSRVIAFQKWRVVKVKNTEVGPSCIWKGQVGHLPRIFKSHIEGRKGFPKAKGQLPCEKQWWGVGYFEQHTVAERRRQLVSKWGPEKFPECLQVRG